VVALGGEDSVARWPGPRPDNVILTSVVPQPALLSCCDVFVTHGGFNGVCESLAAGVPMVVVPLFAEQPQNAARVAELGLGVSLNAEAADAKALRTALSEVLDGADYRSRARRFQRLTLALPPLEQAAEDLMSALAVHA
jgi:MGT family glycosyltransferase